MTGDTTTYAYSSTITSPCTPNVDAGQTTVTDPNGKTTTYCYDGKLRVTKTKDALGNVNDTAFDPQSNVTSIGSTASGASTLGFNATYAFNSDSSVTQIDQGAGGTSKLTTKFAYTGTGNGGKYQPSSVTSPQGNKTLYGYDAKGNSTTTTPDTAGSTGIELGGYDAKGNPATSTDADGNVTSYTYDTLGNLKTIVPPTGSGIGTTTITYDSLSRVKTVTDGKSQVKTYTYDLHDRITKVAYTGGSYTSFVYDDNGNVSSRTDSPSSGLLGVTTLLYDRQNRLKKETRPNTQVTQYTYDGANNLLTLQDAGGTTTYGYGPTNLLTSILEPGSYTPIAYEYDGDNNRKKTTLPNGVEVTSPYDVAGRLQSIKAVKGATVLQDLAYSYTKASVDTTLLMKTIDNKAGNTTNYTYDELDRLDTAITTGTNPAAYDYDQTWGGNRTWESRQDPGAATATTTTYGYNSGNELTSINGSATGLAYDANGNQTTSPTFGTIAYNVRDQITGITPVGGTLQSLTHAGTGQDDLVSLSGATLQNDAFGLASRTSGSTTTYYTRDEAGSIVSEKTGSTRSYLLTDERKSTVGSTSSTGALTASYKYDPYGRNLDAGHPVLGYAGGVRAPGALTHFGARYYEPQTGRWTQQDPIRQANDLLQSNRYGYATLDPINNADPTGEIVPAVVAITAVGGRVALQYAARQGARKALSGYVRASTRLVNNPRLPNTVRDVYDQGSKIVSGARQFFGL